MVATQNTRHFGRPLHSILLFDPRREHSSVPTAYFHRRRAQRRELIDVTHPLVAWMRSEVSNRALDIVPALAVRLDATHAGLNEGLYVFATDFWRLQGVRKQIMLQHVVLAANTGDRVPQDAAERFIEAASRFGRSMDFRDFDNQLEHLVAALRACEETLVEDFLREVDEFENENAARVAQARELIVSRAERIIGKVQATLDIQMGYADERRNGCLDTDIGRDANNSSTSR